MFKDFPIQQKRGFTPHLLQAGLWLVGATSNLIARHNPFELKNPANESGSGPRRQALSKGAGFTLIELMIVVAIIGILASIAIPKFASLIRKSNEGKTKGNLGSLRSVVSIYYGENELYPAPTASGDASIPGSLGQLLTMNNGKYIEKIPACFCPPYHLDNTQFVITVSTVDESALPGSWGFKNTNIGVGRSWGDVWVNCTHTDTIGNNWGFY
jgi:prepilin-type N-terminal cleavage/methylation domain-containing protein